MEKRYSPEDILYRSYIFCKKAGMLSFPTKMRDEIVAEAVSIFNRYLQTRNSGPFYKKIQVDYEGLPESYHSELFPKHEYISSEFYVLDADDISPNTKFVLGAWSPSRNILEFKIIVVDDEFDKERFSDTVEHELSHMIQTFLKASLFMKDRRKNKNKSLKPLVDIESHTDKRLKVKPGYPAQWTSDEVEEHLKDEYSEGGTYYYTAGVEFFPQLRSNINGFFRPNELGQLTKNRYDFMRFIHSNPFMVDLKIHKPQMYRRAVIEAWKIVEDKLNRDPQKEALSKERFESWKFISDNKLNIIKFADSRGLNKIIPISSVPEVVKEAVSRLLKGLQMYGSPFKRDGEEINVDLNDVSAVVFGEDKPSNAIDFICIIENETIPLISLRRPA